MFSQIIGNGRVKRHLQKVLEKGTIANSLLFAGPDGIGKQLFAFELASQLLKCSGNPQQHPDFHLFRPEGKVGMHSIEAMRRFGEEVYLAPFQAPYKVFIIQDAHRMLPTSANALLKTFEEPAENAVIILITSAPASLLPTVLSRCQTLYFQPLTVEEIAGYLTKTSGLGSEEARLLAIKSRGSIGAALRLVREGANHVETRVREMLSKGHSATYKELAQGAKELAEWIEKGKEEMETELRAARLATGFADLPATMRQGLEKEIEGAVTLHVHEQVRAIFETVLTWYRDLEALRVGVRPELLYHTDRQEELASALQRGEKRPLASVQKAIDGATLALERSTSLHICLEGLFLKT